MRMRRILTVMVAVLMLVGALAATGAARGRDGMTRFEVNVIGNVDTEIYYDWGWTLNEHVETTDGEFLGWSGGPCMNLSPDPDVLDRYTCDLGMRLPDGDIIFGGPLDLNEWTAGETVFAVTGGTGKFRHISGEVRLIPAEDFSYSRLIFRVKGACARY